MTILEKRSNTRITALKRLIKKGEYSVEYAIDRLDALNLKGFLTANDYNETFEYLNNLMKEDIAKEEVTEVETEEIIEESSVDIPYEPYHEPTEVEVVAEETSENTEKLDVSAMEGA